MKIDVSVTGALLGEDNMRLDKKNLIKAERDTDRIYVRIYEWLNPTISLGISQNIDAFDLKKMKQDGIDWVSRCTGGKAVWHEKEITYSVAAGIPNSFFGNDLYSSYKVISDILTIFLAKLGLKAQLQKTRISNRRQKSNICYRQASLYEVKIDGKKLIGSSQKRTKKAFLQHGSIPILINQSRLNDYLKIPEKDYFKSPCLTDWIDTPNILHLKQLLRDVWLEACQQI